jgi:hypothetical protein
MCSGTGGAFRPPRPKAGLGTVTPSLLIILHMYSISPSVSDEKSCTVPSPCVQSALRTGRCAIPSVCVMYPSNISSSGLRIKAAIAIGYKLFDIRDKEIMTYCSRMKLRRSSKLNSMDIVGV